MSWNTLRGQITSLVESVTKMSEVSGYPKLQFNGYPGAYVIPSDTESDYETTTENERVYSFLVRVFYETKETGVEDALNNLEDAVDDLLDAVDQEDKKPSSTRIVGINLPSSYTYLSIEAVPSVWGEIPSEHLIMAEVKIRVHVSYDAT